MYKILVVDDEEKIRELIRKYAEFEGHSVTEAENGMEAVALCQKNSFDIVVLDIMMPLLDGVSAAEEIRKFSSVPIIMLTARGEEYDRINGFRAGADDYVVKPFSPRELMMRISAIIKRTSQGEHTKHRIYSRDGLFVDMTARSVSVDGVKISLSPKEYDLLFYMIKNAGIALSREKLICEVWGYDFPGDERTLDTHVKLLRKALSPYGRFIVTLRGVGYRFEN